jgi:hypothetical protein
MLLEITPSSRDLSQDLLNEFFHFHAETGCLYYKERDRKHFNTSHGYKKFNSRYAGRLAGSTSVAGYRTVKIFGKDYKVHRIVWILNFGGVIPHSIDHKNGIRNDNRLENLRLATQREQRRNTALSSRSTSGENGVCWQKRDKRWYAYIQINGKRKNLGYFVNKEDAIAARKAANKKYGYHENHGRENIYA